MGIIWLVRVKHGSNEKTVLNHDYNVHEIIEEVTLILSSISLMLTNRSYIMRRLFDNVSELVVLTVNYIL